MDYKELLSYTRKKPGCLQSEEQRKKEGELRYSQWLRGQKESKNSCSDGSCKIKE